MTQQYSIIFRALCASVVLILTLASEPHTLAQTDAAWPTLTVRDGLASSAALSLVYAPDGSLWMGGTKGVTRWDGQTATIWTRFDGLGDDWVTSLVVVNDVVWAGTYGGGLSRYDPSNSDRPWQTLTTADGLPSDTITALAVGQDGTLWVGTYGGGLARVQPGRIEAIRHGPPSPWISAITVTGAGDVWVGAWGEGVARLSGGVWTTYLKELPDGFVRSLVADGAGHVYVGTSAGLAVWEAGPWQTYGLKEGLPDRRILSLAVAADGTVWAGTAQGLARRGGVWWYAVERGKLAGSYVMALAANPKTLTPALSQRERGSEAEANPSPGPSPTAGGGSEASSPPSLRGKGGGGLGSLAIATPAGVTLMAGAALPPPPQYLPVLFVHGWRGAPFVTIYESEARFLKRWLDERGQYSVYVPGIDSNDTLYNNARRLRDYIEVVKLKTGATKVHLVGHSMGGLTSRAYLESALYQGDVASLTTLGSPHSGAVQWREYLVREVSRGSREPSTRELLPEHVALFNTLGQKPADVPYYLLGGDITAREGLDWLRFWPPTDAVVDLWSALSLHGPGVTPIETQDLHGWASGSVAAGIPSYLWPDDNYQSVLRDILSGRPLAASKLATRPLVRPPNRAQTPIVTGQLGAGGSITHTLTLDAVPGARVFAIWQRGTVTATLTSPAGTVYRQTSDEGVDYFGFNFDTFANMAVYKVDQPQAGRWQVNLRAAPNALTTDYGVYAELDSDIRLTVEAGALVYPPGSPMRLSATLTQPMAATVTADLYVAGQVAAQVTLVDDGTAGDGVAGDGVYNGVLTSPTTPDYYAILVTAVGAEGRFERSASALVAVRSDRARLAGAATVQPDRDGVTVSVPVVVREAGSFAVAVQLAAQGQMYHAVLPWPLTEGSQVVSVPVRGAPPEAKVTQVTLFDNQTALIPIDSGQ